MQDSEIDEETALTLAIVASEEEYKRDSAQRAIRDAIENDFVYAWQLQEEENSKQQTIDPGSSNSQPTSDFNDPLSAVRGTVFNARNDRRSGLRRTFGPRNVGEGCCICYQSFPKVNNRRIWSIHHFWKDRVCRTHYKDGTERCGSCKRLKAIDDSWLRLEDDRQICNDCSQTSLMDNISVQPLYDDVLAFYSSLDLQLPIRPPLALVDKHALNEIAPSESDEGLRSFYDGMTFYERSPVARRHDNSNGSGIDQDLGPPPLEQRQHDVTVIMVLNGLPRLQTGAILAHEVMHAYWKLATDAELPPEVEEGLCQLMSYLWIEKQTPTDPFGVQLSSFIASQIREHSSPIYGDGFRAAFECFQSIGLMDLINHIKITGEFPEQ